MPTVDPITQAYRAVHAALLAWQPWADLVLGTDPAKLKVANFPDVSDPKFVGFRQTLAPNDFPNVALLQGDFILRPHGRNSQVASIDQAFPLVMTLDKMTATPANALKWETLRALEHSGSQLNGLSFVGGWDIGRGTDNPLGREPWARGAQRFIVTLQINVALNIPRSTLFI